MDKDISHILIFGSMAYDEIMDFPGKFVDFIDATKLHQINVSFVVDKLEKQLGGIATNISYNLRQLTDKKISVISAVGKDGSVFFDFLSSHKIDTTYLLKNDEIYTSTGKVITDKNDNQIWGYFYGPLEDAKKVLISSSIGTFAILSATQKNAFLKHQKDLISLKIPYLYDPGMTLTWISNGNLLGGVLHSHYLVGNDYEIAQIEKRINKTKEELLPMGIRIITTLGEMGVLYEDINESIRIDAYKSSSVVDPTGAGDAWRGGFVAGLIEKKSIRDCLVQANAQASFAVEKYGTVNHAPSKSQLHDRISSIEKSINK